MSDTLEALRRQRSSAGDLQSVVRTMKALAASAIGQYERSVHALNDYYRTVELGLGACLRAMPPLAHSGRQQKANEAGAIGAIVFGSDLGLVGQFNDIIADHAVGVLAGFGKMAKIWAVGERVHVRLAGAGMKPAGLFPVPNSVNGIAALVGRIQIESEEHRTHGEYARLFVFHNRPRPDAVYEPVTQQLLPLDAQWQLGLTRILWPSPTVPQVMGGNDETLRVLIREYLFISLFRACAESLSSENASRLAAMQRADKNIDDLIEEVQGRFHRVRQNGIDAELFDVMSGFKALGGAGSVDEARASEAAIRR